mmetsp:Transcript_17021/g.23811  ORF Transcript_17021/g.23811 Transcript_17021/m.23811 type:complete len:389 (-) Transcript_17021:69-1235(-)
MEDELGNLNLDDLDVKGLEDLANLEDLDVDGLHEDDFADADAGIAGHEAGELELNEAGREGQQAHDGCNRASIEVEAEPRSEGGTKTAGDSGGGDEEDLNRDDEDSNEGAQCEGGSPINDKDLPEVDRNAGHGFPENGENGAHIETKLRNTEASMETKNRNRPIPLITDPKRQERKNPKYTGMPDGMIVSAVFNLNAMYAAAVDNKSSPVADQLQDYFEALKEKAEVALAFNARLRRQKYRVRVRNKQELSDFKMRTLRAETQLRMMRQQRRISEVEKVPAAPQGVNLVLDKIEKETTKNAIKNRPVFSSRVATKTRRYMFNGVTDGAIEVNRTDKGATRAPGDKNDSDKMSPLSARKKLHELYSPPRNSHDKSKRSFTHVSNRPAFH